jgi:hypothetical protein
MDTIPFDGFSYEVDEHAILYSEGKPPKECVKLTFTDAARAYEAVMWFSKAAFAAFVADIVGGRQIKRPEPTGRVGV